jgi:histidinol-phosphatase (PHP family)
VRRTEAGAARGLCRSTDPGAQTPVSYPCDTHTHTARCGHAAGRDEEFVEAAIACGLAAVAVTDHLPFYWLPRELHDPALAMTPEELPRYIDAVLALKERYRGRVEVLLGIEADYVEGYEEILQNVLAKYPFDVVLGSEHWVDGWWVDAPASVARYREGQGEVDRIWARYADIVMAVAKAAGAREVIVFRGRRREPVAL